MISEKRIQQLETKIKANKEAIHKLQVENYKLEDELHAGKKDLDPQLDEQDFWLCPHCKCRALSGWPGFNNGGEVHVHCINGHTFYFDVNDDYYNSNSIYRRAKIQSDKNDVEYFVYKNTSYERVTVKEVLKLGEDYERL